MEIGCYEEVAWAFIGERCQVVGQKRRVMGCITVRRLGRGSLGIRTRRRGCFERVSSVVASSSFRGGLGFTCGVFLEKLKRYRLYREVVS